MKIQKVKLSPKSGMLKFRTRLGIRMSRGGRQVCWSPLRQYVNNIMHPWSAEKQLPVQEITPSVPGTVRIVIKHVHLALI